MSKSHPEIIAEKGGPSAVAEKLGLRPATARMWKLRERIPRAAWPEVLQAYPDLSVEALRAGEAVPKKDAAA